MKTIKYFLFALIPLMAFYSCKNDDGNNPGFDDDEVPRIYVEWQQYTARKVGDVVSIKPSVSPSDGASYRWTLDGEVLSTEKDLEYKIEKEMIGVLKFEVVRKESSNSRTTNLLVPQKFKPKTYAKKSIAFLTGKGTIADVDWENITHIVISSAVVQADGSLDISGFKDVNLSTLITYAHHYGVFVMLEASGVLGSYVNAAPVYGSYTFYDNAVGGNYQTLAKNIIAEAKNQGVDGINIYMDKANTANGEFGNAAALTTFYSYLGSELKANKNTIEGEDYDYLLSLSVVAGWTRGAIRDAAKLPVYDWVNVLAFAMEDLAPVPHASQWASENEINSWVTGWIGPIAPARLVLAVPAFGLRYKGVPKDYTWGNLGDYTEYIPYKNLYRDYPDASSKNEIVLKDNGGDNAKEVDKIFYDGIPAIKAKAAFAKTAGLAGMALWSIENDSQEEGASLIKEMNKGLGN